jgi:hypothetical protein
MLGVANAALVNLLLRVDADLPSSAADALARGGDGDPVGEAADEVREQEPQVVGSQSERT